MNKLEIKLAFIEHINNNKSNLSVYKINMIDRYLSFVESYKNKEIVDNLYYEKHHIMPKSLFSEFESLNIHKWNCVNLPLRSHYISHYMLYKIFGGKMLYAIGMMSISKNNRYIENGIESFIHSKLYESVREEYHNYRSSGIKLYYDQGGKCLGYLNPNNISDLNKINDLSLNAYKGTKKQKIQVLTTFQDGARSANTGSIMYNDGVKQKKFKRDEIIPDGFVKGGLKRNLIKGHQSIINWSGVDGRKIIIDLFVEYDGNTKIIAGKIGISLTNLLKNMRRHMPDIDRISYLPNHIRYTKDREFAMELYNLFDGDFDALGEYLGLKSSSLSTYYKRNNMIKYK